MGNTPVKAGEPLRNTPAFFMYKKYHYAAVRPGKACAELTKDLGAPWPEEGSFALDKLEALYEALEKLE